MPRALAGPGAGSIRGLELEQLEPRTAAGGCRAIEPVVEVERVLDLRRQGLVAAKVRRALEVLLAEVEDQRATLLERAREGRENGADSEETGADEAEARLAVLGLDRAQAADVIALSIEHVESGPGPGLVEICVH